MTNPTESYNYCGICGHTPETRLDTPNYIRRWWDPDDGWKFGALCRFCYCDYGHQQPDPDDYAYPHTSGICDDENTDEDPMILLDYIK